MKKNISDVSFIIVTLNEEFAVEKCLNSIAKMQLFNCEIICVDSGSTDNTLSIIRSYKTKFENFRVFIIKGYANSAIARNAGIHNATRKYLYFVDGDVELKSHFIEVAIKKIENGVDVVTGRLQECQYSEDRNNVIKEDLDRFNIRSEKRVYVSGGCFIASSSIVKKVKFFNESFERSQDYDFTLRLSRIGSMIAIPVSMGIHHTVPYGNKLRIKKDMKKLYPIYMGMLIRKNITHYKGILALLRRNKGITFGICMYLSLFFLLLIARPIFLSLIVLFCVVFSDILYGKFQSKDVLYRFYLHYICPLFILLGIVINVSRKKIYSVVEI